jgi:hypothetical protein
MIINNMREAEIKKTNTRAAAPEVHTGLAKFFKVRLFSFSDKERRKKEEKKEEEKRTMQCCNYSTSAFFVSSIE